MRRNNSWNKVNLKALIDLYIRVSALHILYFLEVIRQVIFFNTPFTREGDMCMRRKTQACYTVLLSRLNIFGKFTFAIAIFAVCVTVCPHEVAIIFTI